MSREARLLGRRPMTIQKKVIASLECLGELRQIGMAPPSPKKV